MKSFAKLLLLAAVSVTAIAISAAPSEAAKKKAKAAKAVTKCSQVGAWCTMGGSSLVHYCAGDMKWTPLVMPACMGPGCPPPCS